jgi:phage terminase large subunit-like protein
MVENVIRNIPGGEHVNYKAVRASRGKYVRAEPISALFNPPPQISTEPRAHMVGVHEALEEELASWVPGSPSPNRLDAMVWAYTELNIGYGESFIEVSNYVQSNNNGKHTHITPFR